MKQFDFYEFTGILAPGATVLTGAILLFPGWGLHALIKDISIGGMGVFVVLAYVLGHLVQAVGNGIESVWWKLWGGRPTDWVRTKPDCLLARSQLTALEKAINERQGDIPDLLIVATDANCEGLNERTKQLPLDDSHVTPYVVAIPDPHIERWLLLDGAAFKHVFGRGCDAPDQKCDRDRYKRTLLQAIRAAGVTPSLGGIEFAQDIVQAMNIDSAMRADKSLGRFLDQLRRVFTGWRA